MMRINGIQCNQCSEEKHIDPSVVGSLPNGWISLARGGSEVMQDLHFCTIECLMRWAVNEKIRINDSERATYGTAIAGEDLFEGKACYVNPSDGLAYHLKQEE